MKCGDIIVNPVIIRHTKTPVDSVEGCLSFPDKKEVLIRRYHRCTVSFRKLFFDGVDRAPIMNPVATLNLSGPEAKVFQHEIDHLDGITIFDRLEEIRKS